MQSICTERSRLSDRRPQLRLCEELNQWKFVRVQVGSLHGGAVRLASCREESVVCAETRVKRAKPGVANNSIMVKFASCDLRQDMGHGSVN